jgi:hypothetical protein
MANAGACPNATTDPAPAGPARRAMAEGGGKRRLSRPGGDLAAGYLRPRISVVATPVEAVSTDNSVETPWVVDACIVT